MSQFTPQSTAGRRLTKGGIGPPGDPVNRKLDPTASGPALRCPTGELFTPFRDANLLKGVKVPPLISIRRPHPTEPTVVQGERKANPKYWTPCAALAGPVWTEPPHVEPLGPESMEAQPC